MQPRLRSTPCATCGVSREPDHDLSATASSSSVQGAIAFKQRCDGGNAEVWYRLAGLHGHDHGGLHNIIEEVQVGALGQPAEYGGFTGAIINTVTKSGGNRFSFLS